jgi:hypothetical protein
MQRKWIDLKAHIVDIPSAFDAGAVVRLTQLCERTPELGFAADAGANQLLEGRALFDRQVVVVHGSKLPRRRRRSLTGIKGRLIRACTLQP